VKKLDRAFGSFTTDPSVTVKRLEPQAEQAERQRDLVRDQVRDEETGVRQSHLRRPTRCSAKQKRDWRSIAGELRDEEVRTEAVKLLRETMKVAA